MIEANEKKQLYIELELKWNKRFGWFLSRALMITGLVAALVYLIKPVLVLRIIDGLLGAVVLFLALNVVLYWRERKLRKIVDTF